ncbi:hypothetical protein AVEN_243964-1 [Araneus ventricosus]|uniref:Uncharacterized protein n=1 Tax=Araneus ventricosus TaxID=182803 RepID=A0A4Y2M4X3_ARAVE|nr:hypothetical protein AVEN_243964-1 [Araneus ventricosus]
MLEKKLQKEGGKDECLVAGGLKCIIPIDNLETEIRNISAAIRVTTQWGNYADKLYTKVFKQNARDVVVSSLWKFLGHYTVLGCYAV